MGPCQPPPGSMDVREMHFANEQGVRDRLSLRRCTEGRKKDLLEKLKAAVK
jgi:hypothetical protein